MKTALVLAAGLSIVPSLAEQTNTTAPQTCILGDQWGCSSDVAAGLTDQILAKMEKMGYDFKELNSDWIHCKSPCVNQLQTVAADHLKDAAKSVNDYITLQSAVRSSAQQYLLYKWYNNGMCGIGKI